jgi:hypothetical protein
MVPRVEGMPFAHVHGIVAQGAAKNQSCWSKVGSSFVAAGPALLRSWFPFQIPAKSSELKLVSIAQFYRDCPKLYGELLNCSQIGSDRAVVIGNSQYTWIENSC